MFNGAMLFWRSAQAVGEIDGVRETRVGDLSQGAARIGESCFRRRFPPCWRICRSGRL